MKDIARHLQKRIDFARNRLEYIQNNHGDNPNRTHNYYGGQSLGYWQGLLSAYQNMLDKIEGRN